MEKFFLEVPTIERKKDALDYLNELVEYNSDMNGTGSMERCLKDCTYEQWLKELANKTNQEYMDSIGWAPSVTYFFIRENDNKIIGMINVRYNMTEEILAKGGSHIGYGIRPTERRKGYNKINLYLGMIEAKKLGLEKVMLICDVNNIGSDKTLKALGGNLQRTEVDPFDGALTNVYWFNVDDTISNYKDVYEPCICSKNYLK